MPSTALIAASPLIAIALLSCGARAQQTGTGAPAAPAPANAAPVTSGRAQDPASEGHRITLRYPRDKDRPIAVVGNRPFALVDLLRHISERHHPGLLAAFDQTPPRPEIHGLLQTEILAAWVRQFADAKALEREAERRQLDRKLAEPALSAALQRGFQLWLDQYLQQLQQQGRPTELSQPQIDRRLADYQLRSGLAMEVQGWLDFLEPDDYTRPMLNDFFAANARYFGGRVEIAHILIQHRDGPTGMLLSEAGQANAAARLAEVKARLLPDGSNFAEIARLFSMDGKTAPDGGRIGGLHRFDDRMPAVLCRTAWQLRDGEVSDVVESPFGWHIVQRLDFQQQVFMLFTDDVIPSVREVMRRSRQEDLLFAARERAAVKLLL